MGAPAMRDVYFFEGFRFDRRGLFRRDPNGAFAPVDIGSRALDVLHILVERAGDLVPRDEIMSAVWPGMVVEGSNLPVQVAALRRVLDEGQAQGSCIQTISGRGYRFVARVSRSAPLSPGLPPPLAAPSIQMKGALSTPALIARRRRLGGNLSAVVLILSVIALAGAASWRLFWLMDVRPAQPRSIAILPFVNLGADPNQQSLADAITEDLTTDLSRRTAFRVTSRDTAYTFKDQPVNVKRLGHKLGVSYVLEGSVQRSRDSVRVSAQLINAETDTHIWSERFDRDDPDLFTLQNEIAGRLANGVTLALIKAEAAKPSEYLDSRGYIVRGEATFATAFFTRSSYAQAAHFFEQALAADPQSVTARSRLAMVYSARVLDNMSDTVEEDIAHAQALGDQALADSPESLIAHYAKAQLLRAQHRCGAAISEYETVLASDRNLAPAIANIGRCKIYLGQLDEAVQLTELAMRLSPQDPQVGIWYYRLGQARILQSRVEEAVPLLERARGLAPSYPFVLKWLAVAYGLTGDRRSAEIALADVRRLSGDAARLTIAGEKDTEAENFSRPVARALFESTYFTGLRKAGLPEE